MLNPRTQLCAVLLIVFPIPGLLAQVQNGPPPAPTLRVTSTLVFLDVTVLDKSGHPVVSGLTRDDFTITEDKRPQRIFSFEPPQVHVLGADAGSDREGKAPTTILVLDLLNSNFADFAFIRASVRGFLMSQPEQLAAPAEMLIVGNQSLEMLQGLTRSREDLLEALDHLPAKLPYKEMDNMFFWDRFQQSVDALQQIALQNKGVPGRKNVIWVGHGGPNIDLVSPDLSTDDIESLKQYVHDTTNMLVDSRISLYVIYPGLKMHHDMSISMADSDADIGDDDPFNGDINFGVFANETGGELFYNRNDVDRLIARSQLLGSDYYTLTFQPSDQDENPDGKFRRVRVAVRGRDLRAVTKAGYFAPERYQVDDPWQQTMTNLAEAAQARIPFTALVVRLIGVARHPDTDSAEFTVGLRARNLRWTPADNGKNTAHLILAAVSLDGSRDILASKIIGVNVSSSGPIAQRQVEDVGNLPITVHVPRKTRSVRVVVETVTGGRIGTVDVDLKTIATAPATPTPEPKLITPFPPDTHRPPYVRRAPQ
jgi:VWFA-related protein